MQLSNYDKENILKEIETSTNAKYKLRLKALILKDESKSNTEIAELLGVNRKTITRWLKKYDQDGYKGLNDINKNKKEIEKLIIKDIQDEPIKFGYPHPFWTSKLIESHSKQNYGYEINSSSSAYRLLKNTELRLRQKRINSSFKERRFFTEKILQLQHEKEIELWFMDSIFLGRGESKVKKDGEEIKEDKRKDRSKIKLSMGNHYFYCAIPFDDYLKYMKCKVSKEDNQREYHRFAKEFIQGKISKDKELVIILCDNKLNRELTEELTFYSQKGNIRILYVPGKIEEYNRIPPLKFACMMYAELKMFLSENPMSKYHSKIKLQKKAEEIFIDNFYKFLI